MNAKLIVLSIFTLSLTIQACAPSKNLQVTSARDPLSEDCKVKVYAPGDKPEKYDVLATLKFGDAGFSVSCGKDAIRKKMRAEACKVGANSIIITKEHTPSLISTCYRATAELVHANR